VYNTGVSKFLSHLKVTKWDPIQESPSSTIIPVKFLNQNSFRMKPSPKCRWDVCKYSNAWKYYYGTRLEIGEADTLLRLQL
jgi:hypothetical protein